MLVEHLRSTVDRHNAELQKAVVRRGEWQFTSQHQQLEVPESTWFQMPPECREKQMKKVLTCSVTSSQSSDKPAALISTSSSCTVPHTSESSSQFANSSMTFQEIVSMILLFFHVAVLNRFLAVCLMWLLKIVE